MYLSEAKVSVDEVAGWTAVACLCLVLSKLKVGFLGAGRMSQALARSLLERNVVASKGQIIASDVDETQRRLVTVRQFVQS